MLMLTDVAAKLKKEGGTRQVGRFNLRGNRISFNSACCRIIDSFNLRKHKPKSEIPLRPKKNA
jgi:hypothetical protein